MSGISRSLDSASSRDSGKRNSIRHRVSESRYLEPNRDQSVPSFGRDETSARLLRDGPLVVSLATQASFMLACRMVQHAVTFSREDATMGPRLRFRLITLLSVYGSLIAQCQAGNLSADSLVDVFPLAVGNQWTYRYYTLSVAWPGGNPGTSTADSGRVQILVRGSVTTTDSVSWDLQIVRDLVRREIVSYHGSPDRDTTYPIRDSSAFVLIERLSGQHQLYRNDDPFRIRSDVFPFTRGYTDTTIICRLRAVGVGDTVAVRSWLDSQMGPFFESNFTFKKGIGLTRNLYNSGTVDIYHENEHYLLNASIAAVSQQAAPLHSSSMALSQNFPNPFNPTTTIQYYLPARTEVSLKIFDLLGRDVAQLANGGQAEGDHKVGWDAANYPSGVYLVRLQSGPTAITRKILLIK